MQKYKGSAYIKTDFQWKQFFCTSTVSHVIDIFLFSAGFIFLGSFHVLFYPHAAYPKFVKKMGLFLVDTDWVWEECKLEVFGQIP